MRIGGPSQLARGYGIKEMCSTGEDEAEGGACLFCSASLLTGENGSYTGMNATDKEPRERTAK